MDTIMELNRETANRLWVKQFGKKQKAVDFAGRPIAKAAYNDRNSDFGWNVDHILPESRGGKTADSNLICCSIQTNDEKADRFPAFKANGRLFEVRRRENHYEIIEKSRKEEAPAEEAAVNFYDAAQGVEWWENGKTEAHEAFVAFAKINLEVPYGKAFVINQFREFVKEIFDADNIFESPSGTTTVIFTIVNYNVPTKDDSEEWLNRCVLLNTYRDYLTAARDVRRLQVLCGMVCYENEAQMRSRVCGDIVNRNMPFYGNLAVNELIKRNTSAEKELADTQPMRKMTMDPNRMDSWYPCDFVFTRLWENLQKRIND